MITTSCTIKDHFTAHGWAIEHDFLQQHELDELRQVVQSNSLRLQASCTFVLPLAAPAGCMWFNTSLQC